jgi:hypothetical protein
VCYSGIYTDTSDWETEHRHLRWLVEGGATGIALLRLGEFLKHNAILGFEWRPVGPMMRVAGSDDDSLRRVEFYVIVPSDIAALVKLGDSEPERFVVKTRNDSI